MSITIRETTNKGAALMPEMKVQGRRTFEALCTAGEQPPAIRAQLFTDFGITIDTAYEPGSTSTCNNINADYKGGGLWDVTASFAVPPQGNWATVEAGLNAALSVSVETTFIGDRTDRDALGNPFLNMAHIPFEGGQEVQLVSKRITIVKRYAYGMLAAFSSYENTVNSAQVKLNAATLQLDADILIPADCMLCVTCSPAKYSVGARFIDHSFAFEWRQWQLNGAAMAAPFDYRFANRGKTGHCAEGKGPFANSVGEVLNDPQILDSTGVPVDASVKVLYSRMQAPSAPIGVAPGPTGATLEAGDGFIRYQKYARSAFAAAFTPIFGPQA